MAAAVLVTFFVVLTYSNIFFVFLFAELLIQCINVTLGFKAY